MSSNAMPYLREDVRQLAPYGVSPGTDGIALQRNEAPFELPEPIRDEILERVRTAAWRRYPDSNQRDLREATRRALALPDSLDVVFASGSNTLIQAILTACVDPGSAVVVPQPTFSLYARMTRFAHGTPILIPPRADLGFDVSEILGAAERHDARVIFLCRPNNPTGMTLPLSDIERLAAESEALLVIDEAYAAFAGEDALSVAAQRNNTLVLRTFSKAFFGAGLRIGYAIAQAELIEQVSKTLAPYALGLMATEVAKVALARRDELAKPRAQLIAERDRLAEALATCPGVTVVPSHANFVCAQTPIPGDQLTERLAMRRLYVRDLSEYPGLSHGIRITVGTAEENDRLIDALREELEAT